MIAPTVRTISILMLAAGLSLGVFAGSLMAVNPDSPNGINRVEEAARLRAEYYAETYGLDAVQEDEIRKAFAWYERRLRDQIQTLWREHQDQFDSLYRETYRRIDLVLEEAGVAPKADGGPDGDEKSDK